MHIELINSCLQPLCLTDKEMSGVVRNFQSSFYGKAMCDKLFVSKDICTNRRSRVTITSVVRILDPSFVAQLDNVVSYIMFDCFANIFILFSYFICLICE